MNAPDPFTVAPDWWLAPWPLPTDDADSYQRDAIESAQSEAAQEAARKEYE